MEALRAGAIGYIIKGAGPELMLTVLREALAGRRALTPPLTDLSSRPMPLTPNPRCVKRIAMSC